MPELPQVNPGEPIDSATFGNPVVERVISRAADAAERDAQTPVPAIGQTYYVENVAELQTWDGSAWIAIGGRDEFLRLTGGTMSGPIALDDTEIQIQSPTLGSVSFGPDPTNGRLVRMRTGGNAAPDPGSDGFVIQKGGDAPVWTFLTPSTQVKIGTGSSILTELAIGGESRGTTAPPGFDTIWTPTAAIDVVIPGHWGSALIVAQMGIQVAGGTDTYQVRSRINIGGDTGIPWNQSGNSSAHAVSTSSRALIWTPGARTVAVTAEAILDNTGGGGSPVTKYAHLSTWGIRVS